MKVCKWVWRWISQQCANIECWKLPILGQHYSLMKRNHVKEIQRRIVADHRVSSKVTLPSAWSDRCTTHVCCRWHMGHRHGHSPIRHRTNLRPHTSKCKEVCSTSHTRTAGTTSWSGRGKCHIPDPQREENEIVLGKARQPPQRQPMDLARHRLKIIREDNPTRETSQEVKRRPVQILERHHLAEDSIRQTNLEVSFWVIQPLAWTSHSTSARVIPLYHPDTVLVAFLVIFSPQFAVAVVVGLDMSKAEESIWSIWQ